MPLMSDTLGIFQIASVVYLICGISSQRLLGQLGASRVTFDEKGQADSGKGIL